jgi:large subunit ribosomal protein L19
MWFGNQDFREFHQQFHWKNRICPFQNPRRLSPYAARFNQEGISLDFSCIMSQRLLQLVEQSSLKEKVDPFGIGDTVDVHTKIQEGNKERIQIFSGTVIAKSGSGTREMFVVRRIVAGEGVERKFPVHSPRIEKIDVKRRSVVRRAKLYFLRERSGKSVRLEERRG